MSGFRHPCEVVLAVLVRSLAVFLPVVVAIAASFGGWAAWSGVLVVFGLLSLVELALHLSGLGLHSKPGDREMVWVDRGARLQLWVYAFGHLAAFPYVLWLVATHRLEGAALLGAGASLAVMGGTAGGLGGHELFHRRQRFDRTLGILVYGTVNYAHFAAGHLRGHHLNVGLHHDWGTARRGETIYGFLRRALVDGFWGALRLEGDRLKRRGERSWGLGNAVVRSVACGALVWGVIAHVGGARTLAFFVTVSAVTIAFMELFNYISHYALTRPEGSANVSRSAALSAVTWESNNKVVNWFIFNAGRHSHHHHKPAHGFDELTLLHEKTEYIPHGIALMAVVSFVSPLYLAQMERLLARHSGQVGQGQARQTRPVLPVLAAAPPPANV